TIVNGTVSGTGGYFVNSTATDTGTAFLSSLFTSQGASVTVPGQLIFTSTGSLTLAGNLTSQHGSITATSQGAVISGTLSAGTAIQVQSAGIFFFGTATLNAGTSISLVAQGSTSGIAFLGASSALTSSNGGIVLQSGSGINLGSNG